jgi:hypothetical protein
VEHLAPSLLRRAADRCLRQSREDGVPRRSLGTR